MTTNTHLEHLVLKIKSESQSLNFYSDFLSLMGYQKDFESENYINYSNPNLAIGLYFETGFVEASENVSGLGHLAWQTHDFSLIDRLCEVLKKYELEHETLGENRNHHNQEFFTVCFYCPSGNRLELIYKE